MKKRDGKIKCLTAAALLLAVGVGCAQTGCGNSGVQDAWTQDATEDDLAGKERKVPVGNLELVPEQPEVSERETENGTEVSIGSLEVILPSGWEMEMRVSEEGMEQYVLVDVHSWCEDEEIEGHKDGYEHDIVITPYQIQRMPEGYYQLAAEMKAYFPLPLFYGEKGSGENGKIKDGEIRGCWMYGENSDVYEDEYFLFSESREGGMELFHVREGSMYVTANQNEIESFREFMDGELVRTDCGRYPVHKRAVIEMEFYDLLNENTEHSMFMAAQDGSDEVVLYQTEDYRTEIAVQKLEDRFRSWSIGIVDLNQDGYEDMLCRGWLLEPWWILDFVSEDEFEGYLWDAESSAFVYIDGREMLERYGAVWEGRRGEEDDGQEYGRIPEELMDEMAEYLSKGREELLDAVHALASDRELTMEEVKALAKENKEIKNEMLVIASSEPGRGVWLKADADNDGIEDIFLCRSLGGSLGDVDYCIFAGTEDGHYQLVLWWEWGKEEFTFIQWEGKNYLVNTTWEFTRKCMDGISLEYFENGMRQGGVWLAITAMEGENARSIQTSYLADKKYQGLASKWEEFSKAYEAGGKVPCGTAEEEGAGSGYDRRCDLDNDGIIEEYHVGRFQTTNYYTVDCLNFSSEQKELSTRMNDIIKEDGKEWTPMNLWVDKTEFGNVVYVLYEEELYDFHICGYLLSESWQKLVQVDCEVRTEVVPERIKKPMGIVMH